MIFPRSIYCISCGSIIDRTRHYGLCDSCMDHVHWIRDSRCAVCGKDMGPYYKGSRCYDCMIREHDFDRAASAVTYGIIERGLAEDYKYGDRSYLAPYIAGMMYDRLAEEDWEIDEMTWVPIHEKRMEQRGYDQSRLLAEEISRRSGIPVRQMLARSSDTAPLKDLTKEERFHALKGAFKAKEDVKGLSILLIDDIYTTGATADECSRILKEAGAERVYVLTFASGPNRKIGDDEADFI